MTRLMRPPERGSVRDHEQFDPIVEGAHYQLSREISLAIWERVRADATDALGTTDTAHAEQRFHELSVRLAARGGRLRPDVGKLTRVGVELAGQSMDAWPAASAPRVPGRETRVMAEARRRALPPLAAAARPRRDITEHRSSSPVVDPLTQVDALAAFQRAWRWNPVTDAAADPLLFSRSKIDDAGVIATHAQLVPDTVERTLVDERSGAVSTWPSTRRAIEVKRPLGRAVIEELLR